MRAWRSTLADLLLIALLGLAPLIWFRGQPLINGADFALSLDPVNKFIRHTYAWNDHQFAGWDHTPSIPGLFPFLAFFAFFSYLGVSVMHAERLWFALSFILPGLSMYYLTATLDKRRVTRLASAIFYMFNPYVIVHWHDGRVFMLLAYGILPALLGMYIKGLSKRGKSIKYAMGIALASLVLAPCGLSPVTVVVIFIFVLYFVYHTIVTRKGKFHHSVGFTSATSFFVS